MSSPAPRLAAALLLLIVAAAPAAAWQVPAPPPPIEPTAAPAPAAAEPEAPAAQPEQPAAGRREEGRGDLLPKVDIFFPEGDFDFRLSRLIKNAFVEGQFKYNFVKGDITAFLRYRYYAYDRTYQIGFFDAVEFPAIEKRSNDFDRVRGALLLTQWPYDFHSRAFLLAELDRISSSKEEQRFSTDRTNTFLRLGYQLGTPVDERSNAIVGESRARIQRLFSAYREIGPYGAGLTGAVTWGFDVVGGDFDYVKAEFEGLKRFSLPRRMFFISRLHGGTFLRKQEVRDDPELEPEDRFSIPRIELYRLDGRENLKGLTERRRGTEELHTTVELFVPWFEEEARHALKVEWRSWYWVLYGGYGTIGFDREVYRDPGSWVPDAGVGFEASFRLRRYNFFLSGIVAHAFEGDGDVKAKLSIKSFH